MCSNSKVHVAAIHLQLQVNCLVYDIDKTTRSMCIVIRVGAEYMGKYASTSTRFFMSTSTNIINVLKYISKYSSTSTFLITFTQT